MTDRYVILSAKESTYGTDPATGDQEYRVISNGVKYLPDFDPVRTIEGGRGVQRKELVGKKSEGGIVLRPVYDKKMGNWLMATFGVDIASVLEAAVSETHVFTPLAKITDTIKHPSYTMRKGMEVEERPYTGLGVRRLAISAPNPGLMEWTVDCFAKTPGSSVVLKTLSNFSTQNYISSGDIITKTVGGTAVDLEEWSLEYVTGGEPVWKQGDLDVNSIDYNTNGFSARFTGTLRFLTNTQLADFISGTARAIVIKYQGPTLGVNNYSLQFDFYKLKFEDTDIEVDQENRLVHVIGGELEDDGTNGVLKVTMVDDMLVTY